MSQSGTCPVCGAGFQGLSFWEGKQPPFINALTTMYRCGAVVRSNKDGSLEWIYPCGSIPKQLTLEECI